MKALVILILAVAMSACTAVSPGALEGGWLADAGTHPDAAIPMNVGNRPTLQLEGERITGQSHCNTFSGRFRVNSSGRFQIVDGLAVTEMACVDPVAMDVDPVAMDAEQRFLDALGAAVSFRVEDGSLILEGNGHRLSFSSAPPNPQAISPPSVDPDTPTTNLWFPPETFGEWELERGTLDGVEIPIAPTHPVTLSVSVSGFGGQVCNHYGFVAPEPGNEAFPDIFSTMMLCTEPLVMDSEAAYLDALRRFASARIEAGHLVVEGDGVRLTFRPTGGD